MNRYLQSGPLFRTQDRHASEPPPEPRSQQAEIDLLADLARVSRVTVLYGDEASGRERVVRATVSSLEQTAPPHAHTEIVLLFDTWDKPALPELHARILDAVAAKTKVEATEFAARPLADSLAAWQKVLDLRFIIVLDCFEQYLDLPSGRTGTAAFDAELTRMINEPGLRANFLIVVEKSAEPLLLARFRKRIRRFADSSVRLGAVRDPIAPRVDEGPSPGAVSGEPQENRQSEEVAPPEGPAASSVQQQSPYSRSELDQEYAAEPRVEPSLAPQLAHEAEPHAAEPAPLESLPPPSGERAAGRRKVMRMAAIAAVPLALAASVAIFMWPQEPALSTKGAPAVLTAPEGTLAQPASPESTPAQPLPPESTLAQPAAPDAPFALAEPQVSAQEATGSSTSIEAAGQTAPPAPVAAAALPPETAVPASPPAETAVAAAPAAETAATAQLSSAVPVTTSATLPPAPPAPGAVLSIFVRSEAQRAWAERTIAALGPEAARISGINVMRAGPISGDLRYFRPEEREEAEQLARALQAAGFPAARVKEIPGFQARATPRYYEVWLAPAAEMP